MPAPVIPFPRDDSLPGTLAEFVVVYSDESRCAELLRRWKYGDDGFRCPRCDGHRAWYLPSRRLDECTGCHHQVSLTAGTVMHGTRKPLRLWFLAMYLFVASKRGISALELQRELGLATYRTAWTWLHKLRNAIAMRSTSPLRGPVEIDETWEGGLRRGKGGRPKVGDRSALVMGAVEVSRDRKGIGRIRLDSVHDGSAKTFKVFLKEHVTRGATLFTDDWRSYRRPAKDLGHDLRATNLSKCPDPAHLVLPAIHRVFSLIHRVLLGTYQGGVRRKYLPGYLAEFEFRFNRRSSASRGLLFQRVLACATRRSPPFHWEIVGRVDARTPLAAAA
jgi:hypothetical protein